MVVSHSTISASVQEDSAYFLLGRRTAHRTLAYYRSRGSPRNPTSTCVQTMPCSQLDESSLQMSAIGQEGAVNAQLRHVGLDTTFIGVGNRAHYQPLHRHEGYSMGLIIVLSLNLQVRFEIDSIGQ